MRTRSPARTDDRNDAAVATVGAIPVELAFRSTLFRATQCPRVLLYRWKLTYLPAKLVAEDTRTE